jgi:hypothetical protein
MERLRKIRDAQRSARRLNAERDRLIRHNASRYTERQLAQASGLSQTRVHEICER